MKVKLDEHLPRELKSLFAEFGHEADTVKDEGLKGYPDTRLLEIARRENRLFVTQDSDFAELHWREKDAHAGILLLKLKRPNRPAIRRRIHSILCFEKFETWAGCIAVATETTIRVQKQFK